MIRSAHLIGLLCLCSYSFSGMTPAQNESNGGSAPADAIVYLESPSGAGSLGPNLSVGPAGDTVLLSWLEPTGSSRTTTGRRRTTHAMRWAKLEGEVWTAPSVARNSSSTALPLCQSWGSGST